jgi:hypothetical protein
VRQTCRRDASSEEQTVAIVIREITSEVALEAPPEGRTGAAPPGVSPGDEDATERIVQRAVRRVLEQLRMEWDR